MTDADWARQAVAEHIACWTRMLAAQREREARNLRRHAEKAEPKLPPRNPGK